MYANVYYTKEMICLWMFSFVLRFCWFFFLFFCSYYCWAKFISSESTRFFCYSYALTHAYTIQSLSRGDSDWGQNNLHAPALAHSLFSSFVLWHENMRNFVSAFVVRAKAYTQPEYSVLLYAEREKQMLNAWYKWTIFVGPNIHLFIFRLEQHFQAG